MLPLNPARRRWIAWTAFALSAGACSSSDTPVDKPPPGPPPGRDPAHCTFEEPPARDPRPASGPARVRAGLGVATLPVPIGAPLGGYASRVPTLGGKPADDRAGRFVTGMVPSVGVHDALLAEALAIEAGEELAVILRVDAPLLNENTLFELESVAAPDGSLRGRILLTASHSHGAWAGWQPSLILMPGVDAPHRALADRVIGALAKAVQQAVASLEPARVGVAVDTDFDPTNSVNRDRRDENDAILDPHGEAAHGGKDATAWALRVDREDGSPLAALVNVPLHGTIGGDRNLIASTDVVGGITRALSAELGYPVLHLQGAAGDVSPAGEQGRAACPDAYRCLDMPRIEALGARAATLLAPLVQGVQTGAEAGLEVVTRTFYVGREAEVHRPDGTTLAYAPVSTDPDFIADRVIFDERGRAASPIDEFNTAVGAGLCGDGEAGSFAPIPGARSVPPYSSCLELTQGKDLVFGLFEGVPTDVPLPLCDSIRATGSAIRLSGTPSGDWLILGIPGEPTAPFAHYLRSRSPAGPERTLLVGYADDHLGYLLTAEDWLSGGYEPSINIWGPLEGEIVIDGLLEAASIAWTPEREDPEAGSSRWLDWTYPITTPIEPGVTSDHGQPFTGTAPLFWPDTAETSVPFATTVPRAVGAARFAWAGGDPAIDAPEILIEREISPGLFESLTNAQGRPVSAADGAFVLTYTPDPLNAAAPTRHLYGVVWQPVPSDPFTFAALDRPFSLPLGRYRFVVRGTAQASSGAAPYEVTSDPFEVVAAALAASSSASRAATGIDVVALVGGAPGIRALRVGPSDVDVPLPGPWTATVVSNGAPPQSFALTPDAAGAATLSLPPAELAAAVSIEIRDAHGNGGVLTL
ncbi:hypothetical protein [Chondromyces crocatus]|uniref:Neutral/alkaline non-lysosomal ceramidase N-terminal domain-containing protein n=1 Tax=Chondromyces crocatus TaxID=52 RepID=A0A0K1E8U2_CHOCO|nr:hypothetical protein [Chondromyces crocatus]AKT37285.1 uncharacterized protein CMC5_014160 [Chondromyces crocatus]